MILAKGYLKCIRHVWGCDMYKFDLKNNPDLALARKRFQNRAYYARNRARVLAAHRAWRDANPEYDMQYMRDARKTQRGQ